ncbi:hypothetical protein [Nitrosomonas aestuarii]|nr:hypothetical protein [Nitrosomonas aestuarii]
MAKRDGTSLNQFIAMAVAVAVAVAVAEKVSALETEDFFKGRAKQANLKSFEDILFRPDGETPREGDELGK